MFKKDFDLPEYEKYVNEIIRSFSQEIEQEFNLRCIGDGGSMPHDVEKIEILFSGNHRASIGEAREIEVKIAEKLLAKINTHEKIRPFLREYPFTPERIGVMISFNNKYNDHYSDGTVTFMGLAKGKIYYDTYDSITDKLVEVIEEPYEEAKKIVQEKPLNRDPRFHQPTPYEARVDQLFDSFAKEAKKRWGLALWREGGKMANGIEEVAIHLVTPHTKTLGQMRTLEVEITERLLEIINSDLEIRPYLKEYPFTTDRTKVAISSKTSYVDYHHEEGSVAMVHQENGTVFYLYQRPPEKGRIFVGLSPLAEEPYEDAKKIVANKLDTTEIDQRLVLSYELAHTELLPPKADKLKPLQGKIINGRYSFENIFSCQADDFGEDQYIVQDGCLEKFGAQIFYVCFYNPIANFKKAEVIFIPGLERVNFDKKGLRNSVNFHGIGVFKDNAKGIETLQEELIDDKMLFVAVSVEKMSVLRDPTGKHLASTIGYLIFQENDKLVLLSNQKVTPLEEPHTPKKNIEKLKKDLLGFKKSLELGPYTYQKSKNPPLK